MPINKTNMTEKSTHLKITDHYERGNALADAEEYREAFKEFLAALQLIPEPIEEHEVAAQCLACMGDCYFMLGNFEQAKDALTHAMHCPGALGNPFIHLRLGQSQFELGNEERAKDELARAYMGAGLEIFEDEDAKYIEFLKQFMDGI